MNDAKRVMRKDWQMDPHGLLSEETLQDHAETPDDHAETPRNYWLAVWRGLGAGGAECVAQTADYELVRAVITGLHRNFLIEDDGQDCIFDPEFIRSCPAIVAGLTRQIRQAACRDWPDTVNEENGEVSETES